MIIAVPWQVRNSDDAATLILLSLLCCCNYDSDVLSPAHSLILSFSLTCRFFRLLGWSLRISISSIRVAEASELLHGFCFMGLHPALRSPSCWTDSLALPIEYCNNDNQIGIILISTLWQKQLLTKRMMLLSYSGEWQKCERWIAEVWEWTCNDEVLV